MQEKIRIFSEIFEKDITEADFEKEIGELLNWDSFLMIHFMAVMSERFGVDVTLEQLAEVETVSDILGFITNK